MAVYQYKPYYSYDGPTRSDPLRDELSPEEIERRMELFRKELPDYFDDLNAKIGFSPDISGTTDYVASITTDVSQGECDERVKRCLNNLDLFAEKQ